MDKNQQKFLHEKLLKKKKLLEQTISGLEAGLDRSMKESTGELSLYDNHPADIGDELFERSKDIALRDNEKIHLKEVEKALLRMKEGSFGMCARCEEPIEEERLLEMPEAIHCLQCRRKLEGEEDRHPRPLEEDIINPSLAESSGKEGLEFDREDAWQAVARFGSSDTPADLIEEKAQYPNVYEDWDEDLDNVEDVEGIAYTIDEEGIILKDYGRKIRNGEDVQSY